MWVLGRNGSFIQIEYLPCGAELCGGMRRCRGGYLAVMSARTRSRWRTIGQRYHAEAYQAALPGPALPGPALPGASATRTQRYQDQRYQDQRYEVRRPGPGDPAYGLPPLRKARFRRTRRLFRRRSVRVVSAVVARLPRLGDVLRRPGGLQEQRPGRVREPRGMGQGPLPRPGRDVRRVAVLQPAAQGRQAVVLARRAERRGGHPGQDQAKASRKAFVPDIPATLKSLAATPVPARASGAWWRR